MLILSEEYLHNRIREQRMIKKKERAEQGQKRIIIFDLDGTLINAYPAIIESFNYTMKRIGAPLQDANTICRAVGWGDKQLLRPFVKEEVFEEALKIYRHHHKKALIAKARLLPWARWTLEVLKRKGFLLAIATNRPTKFSNILLRHLELKKYFDMVLCGDRVKRAKPFPDILERILQRFRLKPHQAFYVGDMPIDVQAGKRARIKTIVIPSKSSSVRELKAKAPYKIIENLRELTKIVTH